MLFMAFPGLIMAQSECGDLLRQAQRSYDEGHPETAMSLINDCISEDKFTRNEAIQAYRLITIIHLMENDPMADQSFQKLLKLNPEFRVDYDSLKADPAELVFLYESFHTDPRIYFRVHAGINSSRVNEGEVFDISPDPFQTKEYSPGTEFQAGIQIGIPLFTRNIRLNAGLELAQVSYDLRNSFNAFGPETNLGTDRNDQADFFEIRLTEVQQLINIPISISVDFDRWSRYNFERNSFVPFIYGGITYHQLGRASFPEISTASNTGNFLSSSAFRNGGIDELRNDINFSLTLGLGFKLKVFRNYLVVDGRYSQGLTNVVNADLRYANAELVHGFGHLDSDFKFNTLSLSVGYEVPIYVPKRRKIK